MGFFHVASVSDSFDMGDLNRLVQDLCVSVSDEIHSEYCPEFGITS